METESFECHLTELILAQLQIQISLRAVHVPLDPGYYGSLVSF